MNNKVPKKIFALFDHKGIYVYQAFDKRVANEALKLGCFGKHFYLDRLSWIKPSFGWMLYRSNYAMQAGQTNILRIQIPHHFFLEILKKSIPTTQDTNIFSSGKEWRKNIQKTDVRYQWDPDRDSILNIISRKAIQLGLKGKTLEMYAKNQILKIEDVTLMAREIQNNPASKVWPNEQEYKLPIEIQKILGM